MKDNYTLVTQDQIKYNFKDLKKFINLKIEKEIDFFIEDIKHCQCEEIEEENKTYIIKLEEIKKKNKQLFVNRIKLINEIFKVLKSFDEVPEWTNYKLYKNGKLISKNY